ncbi:hypothetical protein [Clostridium sp.]|uniref:hypothetical protein n=1 Tax=Clostridium sp. TaxID=1506 RepID=UPI002FC9F3BA
MININHIIDVATIAIFFYLIDLLWKSSKIYNNLTAKSFFSKKINKLILMIVSIILIVICIILGNKFSGYLVANDSFEITIKGIPLLILYIISSLIFTNNNSKKSTNI